MATFAYNPFKVEFLSARLMAESEREQRGRARTVAAEKHMQEIAVSTSVVDIVLCDPVGSRDFTRHTGGKAVNCLAEARKRIGYQNITKGYITGVGHSDCVMKNVIHVAVTGFPYSLAN